MDPQPVRLFVPYTDGTPWIVRREEARVGTFGSRADGGSDPGAQAPQGQVNDHRFPV